MGFCDGECRKVTPLGTRGEAGNLEAVVGEGEYGFGKPVLVDNEEGLAEGDVVADVGLPYVAVAEKRGNVAVARQHDEADTWSVTYSEREADSSDAALWVKLEKAIGGADEKFSVEVCRGLPGGYDGSFFSLVLTDGQLGCRGALFGRVDDFDTRDADLQRLSRFWIPLLCLRILGL